MTREPAIGAALVERVEFAEVGAAELIEREWRGSSAAVENQAVQAIARRMTQDAGRSAYLGTLHNLRQEPSSRGNSARWQRRDATDRSRRCRRFRRIRICLAEPVRARAKRCAGGRASAITVARQRPSARAMPKRTRESSRRLSPQERS